MKRPQYSSEIAAGYRKEYERLEKMNKHKKLTGALKQRMDNTSTLGWLWYEVATLLGKGKTK